MEVTLREVVDGLPVAGLVTDGRGCIVTSNRAARDLLGVESSGEPVASYFRGEAAERIAAVFEEGSDARFLNPELVLRHENPDTGATTDLRLRLRRLGESMQLRMLMVLETIETAPDLAREVDDLRADLRELRRLRHEANNDLMGLMGHAEIMTELVDPQSAIHRKAEQIMEQARRLRSQLKRMGDVINPS